MMEKKMKNFKVASDLKPYIINILKRRGVAYEEVDDSQLAVNLSGHQFHKVVIRGRCEKADFDKWGLIAEVPHIHPSEMNNRAVHSEIGSSCFIVYDK